MENTLNQKKYVTKKNLMSFAFAGFGQNLIISVVNSYILFFYTDVFLIGAGAASALMLSARIWDAFNDPIMGTIVDKTRTKRGKMRPYILASALPLAIMTGLLFLNPQGLSLNARIVYACITYVLWGMVYTVCDVPFWGISSAITPNPEERADFISKSRLVHSLGSAIPMMTVPFIVGALGNERGYTVAGIGGGLIGGTLFLLAYFGTEERCTSNEKAPTLGECFKSLTINKPLRQMVFANVLGFMRATPTAACMYVATYVLGAQTVSVFGKSFEVSTTLLNSMLIAGWAVAGFVGMIITPALCRRFNYRQIWIVCSIFGALISIILFVWGKVAGYSMWSIMFWLMLSGMPYGINCNINYTIIADSVDYVEWKTNRRQEGITVSFQTLTNKMMTALQSGLVALTLNFIGFVAPIDVGGELVTQVQSAGAVNGIFALITIVPAIGWILSIFPMRKYSFVGEERQKALDEMTARREATSEKQTTKETTTV